MHVPPFLNALLARARQRPVFFGAVALATVLALFLFFRGTRPARQESSFFEVRRGSFLISIVEGGTIEAVNEEIIRSEVEGTARVIFIVPEGKTVKKGDLLVELDSSQTQDAVNQQEINVEKAQFAFIQAEQQLEIQKSTVESEIAAAQLKVEFAKSDLDKYINGERVQLRRNAEIEITNVLETLKINEERLAWTKKLCDQGYETKANLDKDQLAVSQSKLKQEQAEKALWMLQTFDEPKKKRELEALLKEAEDTLERTKLQGDRKLDQFKADVQTQKSTLDLSKSKLERDKRQLLACKIFAPQDGMVVYAGGGDRRFSSESMIEEGAVVRNRQELIKLPDISCMKLMVKVHESQINQVRLGQAAFVVLDAMPDQRFKGMVNRVAPLPDSQSRWSNPNLKVYATEILVLDKLPDVKPGVSARAEIVVTNLGNVLTVPIQAVTTRKGKQVVFLADDAQQPIPVSVGMYNIKFIEITAGLKEGHRVLLSPPFDVEEKDLAGAIIANGDKLPEFTNRPVGAFPEPGEGFGRNGDRRRGPGAARGLGGPGNAAGGAGGEQGVGGNLGGAAAGGGREDRGFGGPRGGPGTGGGDRSVGGAPGGTGDSGQVWVGQGRGRADSEGGGPGAGGPRFNREEMMKQFDLNGDGQLDDNERAAMRERFGRGRRGTNAASDQLPSRPDASR